MIFETAEQLRDYIDRKYSIVRFKSGNYGIQQNLEDRKGLKTSVLAGPERFSSVEEAKKYKKSLIDNDLDNMIDEIIKE